MEDYQNANRGERRKVLIRINLQYLIKSIPRPDRAFHRLQNGLLSFFRFSQKSDIKPLI
jgi:hypothetical protein